MNEGTILSSPEWEDRVAKLVEQYESQWRELIEKIAPPDASSFVSSVELPSPENPQLCSQFRDELWKALESVDQDYRRRLLERPKSETNHGAADDTNQPGIQRTGGEAPPSPGLSPTRMMESPGLENGDVNSPTVSYPPDAIEDDVSISFDQGATGDWSEDDHENAAESSTSIRAATDPAFPAIPGYTIEGVLGRGGMGVVYRAQQEGLNRRVALKMILDKRQADPDVISRFQTEAEAVARLDHENIVRIFEIGTAGGLPYFSLEFVDGVSLEAEWGAEPMDPARTAEIVGTLAQAMARAHAAGLVHRDLKPANVLVRKDGVLKVTDFGLVKRIEEDSGLTQEGAIMGTPSYMAPEQAWGRTDVGPLADVYALGAILYALLTGRPPFQGPNAVDTVLQLRENEPVPPSRLQPKIPRDLETICLKAIEKDSGRRYQSAQELADDLRRYQTGEPIKARPVGLVERSYRWCKRNPIAATALLLFVCLAVGGPTAAVAVNQQKNVAIEAQELAEKNEGIALDAQDLAEKNAGIAEQNANAAEKARGEAEDNAELAKQQRDLSLTAFHEIAERVPTELRDVPGTGKFRRTFLLLAANGLNQVADVQNNDDKDFVIAKAHVKMGEGLLEVTNQELENEADRHQARTAHDQFTRSHEIFERLAKTDRSTPNWRHMLILGRSFRNLGLSTERLDGALAAKAFHEKALKARREALVGADDLLFVRQEIAESLGKLGELELGLGRPEVAMEYIKESADYRKQWREKHPRSATAHLESGGAHLALGNAHNALGQSDEAVEQFQTAIGIFKRLDAADIYSAQVNWAVAQIYLARTHLSLDQPDLARTHYELAVTRFDELHRKSPRDVFLNKKLGQALYGMAVAQEHMKRHDESKSALERCLEVRQALASSDSDDISFQQALMFPLARLGDAQAAAAIAEELRKEAGDDSENLYFVASCYALCAEAERDSPAIAESSRGVSSNQEPIRTAKDFEDLAIATLKDAVAKGYDSVHLMQVDPDLAPIRHLAEFQKLLEEMSKP